MRIFERYQPVLMAAGGEGGGDGKGDGDNGDGDGGKKKIEKAGGLLDAAGGGDGKGDKDGGGDGDDGGGDDGKGKQAKGDGTGDDGTPTRPDWLKEDKYWDEKTGIKSELLFKNIGELEKKFSRGENKAPKEADAYAVPLDAEVRAKWGMDDNDPLLKWFKTTAHAMGMSQDDFNKLLTGYTGALEPLLPEPFDIKAEIAKLGPNGQGSIDAMDLFGTRMVEMGVFSDVDYAEFRIANGTAEGLRMMNKLLEHYGEKLIPLVPAGDDADLPSAAELSAMQQDEKYGKDDEFTKKVDGLYVKRYGTEPAGTSVVMGR